MACSLLPSPLQVQSEARSANLTPSCSDRSTWGDSGCRGSALQTDITDVGSMTTGHVLRDLQIEAERVLLSPTSSQGERWGIYRRLIAAFDGVQHWWCQHGHLARFLAGLLEFPGSEPWEAFQTQLARSTCLACVSAWCSHANAFLVGLSQRYEQDSIDLLEKHMLAADVLRLSRAPREAVVFEALRRVQLLRDAGLYDAVVQLLLERLREAGSMDAVISDDSDGSLLPGSFVLCVSPFAVIRTLAQSLVRSRVVHVPALVVALRECLLLARRLPPTRHLPVSERGSATALWSGLSVLLSVMPDDGWPAYLDSAPSLMPNFVEQSGLIDTSDPDRCGFLARREDCAGEEVFVPIMSCLRSVLSNVPDCFWASTTVPPAVVDDALRHAVEFGRSSSTLYLSVSAVSVIPSCIVAMPPTLVETRAVSALHFLVHHIESTEQRRLQDAARSSLLELLSFLFDSRGSGSPGPALKVASRWISHVAALVTRDGIGQQDDVVRSNASMVLARAIDVNGVATSAGFSGRASAATLPGTPVVWIALSDVPADLFPPLVHAALLRAVRQCLAMPSFALQLQVSAPESQASIDVMSRMAQAYLGQVATFPDCISAVTRDFPSAIGDVLACHLFFHESSSALSNIIRIAAMGAATESPVPECLAVLLKSHAAVMGEAVNLCATLCSSDNVHAALDLLIGARGPYLLDVRRMLFWMDKLMSCSIENDSNEVILGKLLTKDNVSRFWSLVRRLLDTGPDLSDVDNFDSAFSAVFDIAVTMLDLYKSGLIPPDGVAPVAASVLRWLAMRDRLPTGVRRRWFRFLRALMRLSSEARETMTKGLSSHQSDVRWYYKEGATEQSQKNFLVHILPDLAPSWTASSLPTTSAPVGEPSMAKPMALPSAPPPPVIVRRKPSMDSTLLDRAWLEAEATNGRSRSSTVSAGGGHHQRNPGAFREAFQWMRDDAVQVKGNKDVPALSISDSKLRMVQASLAEQAAQARKRIVKKSSSSSAAVVAVPSPPRPPLSLESPRHLIELVLATHPVDLLVRQPPPVTKERRKAKVPTSFEAIWDYREHFGALIVEECRASISSDFILASKQDGPIVLCPQAIDKASQALLPGVAVLFSFVNASDKRMSDFAESDIAIVWPEDRAASSTPDDWSFVQFAYVEGRSSNRISFRVSRAPPDLTEPTSASSTSKPRKYSCIRIASMTTSLRQARALETVGRFRLSSSLVVAANSQPPAGVPLASATSGFAVPPSLNKVQQEAIEHCLTTTSPIVLLQGPPGTGKTTVIVALIQAILGLCSAPDDDAAGDRAKRTGWRKASSKKDLPHILLCAPSNAAADELTCRLISANIQGFPSGNPFPLIRLGNQGDKTSSAYSVSLEKLVGTVAATRVRSGKQEVQSKNSETVNRPESSVKVLRQELLSKANIVVCTLSGSGSPLLSNVAHGFHTVIVDEAGQAVEPDSLVPLQFSCRKLILVGDPKQLPPTVISQAADAKGLSRSLFERLEPVYPPVMLVQQYRMHPQICSFPSEQFYGGRLVTAIDRPPAAFHGDPFVVPYAFYDIAGNDIQVGQSRANRTEAVFIVKLLAHVNKILRGRAQPSIGVITPYQAQVREVCQQADKLNQQRPDVRTIDSFQGQERDVIVFSAVRASNADDHVSAGLGFVADPRRLNVALTRAKQSCLIVGCAATLAASNHVWRNLVDDAYRRSAVFRVDPKDLDGFFRSGSSLRARAGIMVVRRLQRRFNLDDILSSM
ncbi:unnamed protein product (mitochondrion) [Plasmodiophora brassicae]|uniref:AAA+ ATPase domain-containing protein n=1 Tax=Plasmodiophora brassicae TaxID=37360 RepID=A0A3P3Y9V7_PLABS|nr:unnamed protein product [Plasmodiophora brassicae]